MPPTGSSFPPHERTEHEPGQARTDETSPRLATLVRIGMGSGMRSAIGPALRKNSAPKVSGRSTWNVELRSFGPRPAAVRLGPQTGM
jgi:hypothetical protein